ncbi:MAG TPA: STAS domain-containing protein [Candidatus Hydrogenedentes bacterium]|nr:STAS domain-containing protein [Candidatus Hydrogenedentota bacterium]HIJ72914.1 STAS domain-containing protein [Candidatus Hydrogenedentota bacterium]
MHDGSIVSFREDEGIAVATVEAASVLDALNVDQFGKEVQKYVRGNRGIHLLLDFQKVEYLSSAVLTELLRIKKAIAEMQGTMRLCALTKEIRKVFEITNLDQIFVIDHNVETALPRYRRALQVAAQEETWKQLHEES